MTEDEVRVPEEFFRDVLPAIHDLGELKVILHVIDITSRTGARVVSADDLMTAHVVRSVAGLESPQAERRVQASLDRAVADGALLRFAVRGRGQQYLLATGDNRRLLGEVAGDGAAEDLSIPPGAEVTVHRPNVFALYEQYIGPLTPLLAEQLRDAERAYPRSWIEGAIQAAVQYNKRNWRYVQTVLNRWEESGAPDGIAGRRS